MMRAIEIQLELLQTCTCNCRGSYCPSSYCNELDEIKFNDQMEVFYIALLMMAANDYTETAAHILTDLRRIENRLAESGLIPDSELHSSLCHGFIYSPKYTYISVFQVKSGEKVGAELKFLKNDWMIWIRRDRRFCTLF